MQVEDVFRDLPTLETERTVLRKITINDAKDLFDYCSDEEVARYTSWYPHQTIDDSFLFINAVLPLYQEGQISPWGIEHKETDKLIGTCGFVSWVTKHARAEIGYALSRQYWNQGLMTEIVRNIIDFGFNTMQLVRLEARCHVDNIASARVMEKSGMQLEGILRKHMLIKGEHQDLKLYSIIK